jgi:hypothetical protein
MYCEKSFETKKALKEAVAAGKKLSVFQPNNFFNVNPPENGTTTLEGPNFKMHKWYAKVTLENGVIVKVS